MHTAWQDSTVWGLVLGGGLLLIALRLIQNYLPGRTPPVFEGVPFVGGILKFSKVSALFMPHLSSPPTALPNSFIARLMH